MDRRLARVNLDAWTSNRPRREQYSDRGACLSRKGRCREWSIPVDLQGQVQEPEPPISHWNSGRAPRKPSRCHHGVMLLLSSVACSWRETRKSSRQEKSPAGPGPVAASGAAPSSEVPGETRTWSPERRRSSRAWAAIYWSSYPRELRRQPPTRGRSKPHPRSSRLAANSVAPWLERAPGSSSWQGVRDEQTQTCLHHHSGVGQRVPEHQTACPPVVRAGGA